MFSKTLIAAALFSIASFGASHAQEISEQCSGDIAQYCASVTPGDGRVGACLYAHTDRLSEACFAASAPMSTVLESFFDNITEIYQFCSVDIQNHCSNEQMGTGKMMMCLVEKTDEITPMCNEHVTKLRGVIELNIMSVE